MKKIIHYLNESREIIRTVEHVLQTSLPLLENKKMTIRILEELKKAAAYCINAILQYEYLFRNIRLYRDPRMNFKTFINRCSKKYALTYKEAQKIKELFNIIEYHKHSSMEFIRKDKLVIIADGKTKTIKVDEIQEFLDLIKKLSKNIENRIKTHHP